MSVLVTGGTGFIGSHLTEALCREYVVAVMDNLSTGNIENLSTIKNKVKFYHKDILDKDVKKILRDVEIIFHLAAQINVRKSVEDPVYDLDVNAKGIINLVENSPNLERFIFASSGGAVYGEPKYLPVDETHETNPISPYGVSKLAGEKYLNYYSVSNGLKVACLRYANVYGERQDPRGEAGVISIFLDRVKQGRAPVIFGDGRQTRDYVYVGDAVSAALSAINKEGIYNIGTGIETSVNELVDIISKVAGRKIKPVHAGERKGEVRRICLNIKKARDELGWMPEVNLQRGIERMWKESR